MLIYFGISLTGNASRQTARTTEETSANRKVVPA
jgi:hypothetical protein